MLVVPVLLARFGIERIDMVEGGRHIHDAVGDDRRCRKYFLHLGLEDPSSAELAHIPCVDLIAHKISGLIVVAVGMKKVVRVAGRGVELVLRHRCCGRRFGLRPRQVLADHAKH